MLRNASTPNGREEDNPAWRPGMMEPGGWVLRPINWLLVFDNIIPLALAQSDGLVDGDGEISVAAQDIGRNGVHLLNGWSRFVPVKT